MSTSSIEVVTGSRPGAQGFPGYAPVVATVADGTRIVLRVIDWTGGVGPKPAINQYIASTGLTANIAAATDVRGSGAGDAGDNVILSGSGSITAKNHTTYFVNSGSRNLVIPNVTQVSGFDFCVIANQNNVLMISAQDTNVKVYLPSSRSIGASIETMNFVESYTKNAQANFMWQLQRGIYNCKCFNDGATTYIYFF
jgi:hypothetical protein